MTTTFTDGDNPTSWDDHHERETMWFGIRAGQMSEPHLQSVIDCPWPWHSLVVIAEAELRRRNKLLRDAAPERLSSLAEVQIDEIYLTQISGTWRRVRVVGRRPDGRFDVVREGTVVGRLNPRAWAQLRRLS